MARKPLLLREIWRRATLTGERAVWLNDPPFDQRRAGQETKVSANEPTLIVTGGPLDGQVVRVSQASPTRLGSGADTALPVALANVAAHHATLQWDGHELKLSADDTPTGTYVNGERILATHRLSDGDRVCLGPPGSKQSVKFVVRLDAAPEGAEGGDALPGFEAPAPDLGDVLDLSALPPGLSPAPEPPPLVLIDPDAGEGGPAAAREGGLPGWSELPAGPLHVEPTLPPAAARATPAPAPAASPRAATPPPAPAPPADRPRTETRHRPEYTSDIPSMMPDTGTAAEMPARLPGPPPVSPATPKRPMQAAPRRPAATLRLGLLEVPRLAVFVALGLLAGAGAWMVARYFARPAPVLASILPPRVQPGATVTLVGENFAAGGERNEVRFGTQSGQVSFASDSRITVTVPAVAPAGGAADVPVSVVSGGRRSNTMHVKVFVAPNIKSIAPDVALPGGEVVLNIPDLVGELKVQMDGQPAQVLESKGGAVRVRVPDLPVALGRRVKVIAESSGLPGSAAELILGRLPLLTQVSPSSGPPGTPIKITGRGFAAEPAGNAVTVGGVPALVISASAQELTVAVPVPGGSGTVTAAIEVRVGGVSSNPLPLVVDRLSTLTFVLRCFAAPVPGDTQRAYVATEYGPLLLLSDKGAAASTAERAVQVSAALNQLADSALSGRPPAFELRESPRPSVGLVGGAEVLAPEAADATGYGPRASSRALAAHWTAVLTDTFALFVEFRRPTKLAESTPAGKLLIDLFAEAQRRAAQTGAGPGVPRAQLFPMSTALEKQLKELALQLPGAQEKGAAAVVVEGTWDGTMQEQGLEPRTIQLTLKRAGGRLTGSLTTSARTLTMGIPLNDVTYDKGTLRFTIQVGGVPRTFSGALQGATVSGSISSPASKEPLGTFSLNFVK